MKNIIAEITETIRQIKGCQFASITYLSKKDGGLARYTVNLGFNYHTAVLKSITELEILIGEGFATELEREAATEVMESLKKTVAAHEKGEQNDDYTKKGQYIPIGNGLNLNTSDNTIQLFGLCEHKTVIVAGTYKEVKSKPLTIAKNRIRKALTVSKFREFALDVENVNGVKVNGNTIEFVSPYSDTFVHTVNTPTVTVNETQTVNS